MQTSDWFSVSPVAFAVTGELTGTEVGLLLTYEDGWCPPCRGTEPLFLHFLLR